MLPLWSQEILPHCEVRTYWWWAIPTPSEMVKHMDQNCIDDIQKVTIPSAIPLVYQFDLKEKMATGGAAAEGERT